MEDQWTGGLVRTRQKDKRTPVCLVTQGIGIEAFISGRESGSPVGWKKGCVDGRVDCAVARRVGYREEFPCCEGTLVARGW